MSVNDGQHKKLMITGGSGDLGRVLSVRAVAAGYDVTATYLAHPNRIAAGTSLSLDLCDRDAVQAALDTVEPDVIIHTALALGVPNPRQQIVTAAYHLSQLSAKHTRLIFLSSDMVFDGLNAPYRDEDAPSPLTLYGQAKAEMEMMVDHVVRTSLIYDFVPGNKQIDWMLAKIAKGEHCRLFIDEFRSAVWVVNLADALLELIGLSGSVFKGILNVAGPQSISRFELGASLLYALGYNPEEHTEAASQADTGRQPDLTLDVSKAQMILKTPLLTLAEALTAWEDSRRAESRPIENKS